MHDVIVVGAGPAGNIAALRLAEMGHRVAVLDWRHKIGDKLCTGIVGTECAEHFPPDKSHVYREARSAILVSPSGRRYHVARKETQALIIDRVAYVESMARRAMAAGADYQLGVRIANIEVSDSGVTVFANSAKEEPTYRSEVVIIASGFGSPLVDLVGLRNGRSNDYMVGAQAEVSANGLEDTEVYVGGHVAPGSFGWLVPLSGSRALIGLVSRRQLNGHMDRFLDELRLSGRVTETIKEPKQWGIPLRPLPKTYGDRVLVAGDAAGLVKPTTGGGIYYALRSGEIAAAEVHKAFAVGDFSARQLKHYQSVWKSLVGLELSVGYCARMLYEALGDWQLERLIQATTSRGVREAVIDSPEFAFDWHSGVILKAARHRLLGGVLRSFGPMVTPILSRLVEAKLR